MQHCKILALSGSLRKKSYNSALIEALIELAPKQFEIVFYKGIADLPLFNPDLEDTRIPTVNALRHELGQSDGLIIASPEYAHGITGLLKNALDWLVSGEEFVYMPVLLCNTSPRAKHAQLALREVIKTMSGIVVEEASITVPLLGSGLDAAGIIKHKEISSDLKSSLNLFHQAIFNSG